MSSLLGRLRKALSRKVSRPAVIRNTRQDSLPPQNCQVNASLASKVQQQQPTMGGGNGAKSATKRERNASKSGKSAKGSQSATNAQALTIICKICRASFMCTMTEASLRQHVDSKHSKLKASDCFDHLK